MTTDFHDAHNRHWDDAELLYESERWANADQLYGLSAECGLKKLMVTFDMPFDAARGMPSLVVDKVHANRVWDRYEAYRSGHHAGTDYGLVTNNPFTDWDISNRYSHRNDFSKLYVDPHKSGADEVRRLIRKAVLEGII